MHKYLSLICTAFLIASCTPAINTVPHTSNNSWSTLTLNNDSDIPPEWSYREIPKTPFEIPLPETAVIELQTDIIQIFSYPENARIPWERNFGIEFSKVVHWNESFSDYIYKWCKDDMPSTSSNSPNINFELNNDDWKRYCHFRIYKTNGISSSNIQSQRTPGAFEFLYFHQNKVYHFGLWFQEHAGAQPWARLALRNLRLKESE